MELVTVKTGKAPKWMPESVIQKASESGKIEIETSLSRAERNLLLKRQPIKVSEWAAQHRVLTMSALPGKWRNETTPYLVGIMDAIGFPSVNTNIVCAVPQSGKSESANNWLGYIIDRAPDTALIIYPDETTAKENSVDRIRPMIESSRRLRTYLTGYDDDLAAYRIKLNHMQIYFAWATSASRLANKPIRYIIFDEVDKYPEFTGKKEADPMSLGEKRVATYKRTGRQKIWKISTPTVETGQIWKALNEEAQVIFDYWVVCPSCKQWLLMSFDQIKWQDGERDAEKVEAEKLAWYECPHCLQQWNDTKRDKAVRLGEWRARTTRQELMTYLKAHKPAKVGFHLPAWISPFVSLSESAAAFLRGLNDKGKLKDFMNAYKAEPWVIFTQERTVERILKLKDDRPEHLVPSGRKIAALTAGIDTQDDGFWFEVRAWVYGRTLESYQIDSGFVTTFQALDEILFESPYTDAEGYEYHVRKAVIDSGGHKTAKVYEWARRNRGRVLPLKGMQRMNRPYRYSQIDTYPGTNKPIPGGVKLLLIDTNYYKDQLSAQLEINPGDPGAWHLNKDTTDAWCEQMTVEYLNDKGVWECPSHKANHAWDCSVYALAAADVCHVKRLAPPEKRANRPERKKKEPQRRIPRW